MTQLFTNLSNLMSEGILVTSIVSFIWGILSIALSPCHLTSIPLIIGVVDNAEEKNISTRFIMSSLFASGILISIALIGIITASAGRIAGDVGSWSNWLAAIIFAIIGFNFFGIIPLNFKGISKIPIKQKGIISSFLIGLIFGVALGPCTFAFMAPVLAVTFTQQGTSIISNAFILLMYGLGHSLLIVLAGTFTNSLQNYLVWITANSRKTIIKKGTGIFLLLGALYFLFKA